jgi:hypothetical protein
VGAPLERARRTMWRGAGYRSATLEQAAAAPARRGNERYGAALNQKTSRLPAFLLPGERNELASASYRTSSSRYSAIWYRGSDTVTTPARMAEPGMP